MSIIKFRPYQLEVFDDRESGVQVLCWSRQIGKSFVLAAWAVDRLLTRPGRLVTVLSNSKDNGSEFALKCAEVCRELGVAMESVDYSGIEYADMRFEISITVKGRKGRIKVLAANPRTARGFSGDLILDEFAFHEDSYRIWEAAEPILSSNPDYLCRIASTLNGTRNLFYRLVAERIYPLSLVRRSDAWRMGVKILDPVTRKPITPEEARAKALDKAAYDQNYECIASSETAALLTHDLINQAEWGGGEICDQDWSESALDKLRKSEGPLYAGLDVARRRDFSFCPVAERAGDEWRVLAALRMRDLRLPEQQRRLDPVLELPAFRRMAVDMTGIGLGLFEYAQERHGSRVVGVDFGTSVPVTRRIQAEGRKAPTVRVTEAMAVELLALYEDRRIKHPCDPAMRDDLRKPERVTSPGGRVSIAATRDEAGHADHFWGLALMVRAGSGPATTFMPRAFGLGRREFRYGY